MSADCFYPITEDLGCIAFAQHAIKQMKDKLQIYDRLLEVQEKWRCQYRSGPYSIGNVDLVTLVVLCHIASTSTRKLPSIYFLVCSERFHVVCIYLESTGSGSDKSSLTGTGKMR